MNGKNFAFEENLLLRPTYDGKEYVFFGAYGLRGGLEIPAYYRGLPVTAAGNRAEGWNFIPLYGCAEAEAAVLPETLKRIYDSAFRYCGALKEIILPNGVESVGNHAFYGCRNLGRIAVGNGVKTIGRNAFAGCGQLLEIDYFAKECQTAGTPTYPVFEDCGTLKKVNFESGIRALPNSLFYSCKSLEEINLPEGLEEIGEYCFCGCVKVREIYLPSTLKSLGWGAFKNCAKIEAVIFGGTKEQWLKINKNSWEYPFVKCKNGIIIGADG